LWAQNVRPTKKRGNLTNLSRFPGRKKKKRWGGFDIRKKLRRGNSALIGTADCSTEPWTRTGQTAASLKTLTPREEKKREKPMSSIPKKKRRGVRVSGGMKGPHCTTAKS